MSLVGTRPILPDELEQYELHHRARIAIKPGITGMWQVSGRSDITDAYKEELSKNETEEDLGDISITIPTDAPDNAAGKDTTSSSDKSSNTDSADSGSDSEK